MIGKCKYILLHWEREDFYKGENVKKVYVIGTEANGRGGIAIASGNLIQGLLDHDVEVDEVMSHSEYNRIGPFINAFIYLSKERCKGQLFWFQVGPWLSLLRKLFLILLVKAKGGNILVQVHSQSFETYTKSIFLKPLYQFIFMISDYVGFLGGWWSEFAKCNYNIPKNKILIIPNFINTTSVSPVRVIPKGKDKINLLAMSRLAGGKGFESIIELMPYLDTNFHLHIAGDGPLKTALMTLVNELDLHDRITFHGWANEVAKAKLLKDSHLFILPSSNDSFGLVFIEAMSTSLPVVALKFKGVCDVVPHMNGGYLCENTSPEELKSAIETLLKDYNKHTISCRQYVESNFTPQVVIPALIQQLRNK